MSEPETTTAVEPRRRFTLPSAYTILFGLIVVMALATWIIPAGDLRPRQGGRTCSRHLQHRSSRTLRGS